ncbi:MaoC/PaaZ C-terminal domain-containing protein [Actinomadura rugatobispora]|uniref:MaoC/PaaZ C-terminal domain-containing protein n=1 Tax=Actinomadura rugatobispora TaxID=1994 RepID=A0ABW0ZYR5_9ACTN|nr:dihydroxy-acid dehydratase [Actinomadura rugatobispora]
MSLATGAPEAGAAGPERVFGPVTRTDIVRYAGASGDFNPLHHDEARAREAGLPAVLSIGMYQGGLLGTYVTDWLGTAFLHRFRLRFSDRVWPGDVLACTGTVTSATPVDGAVRVVAELRCVRQTGDVAVTAVAEYLWGRP